MRLTLEVPHQLVYIFLFCTSYIRSTENLQLENFSDQISKHTSELENAQFSIKSRIKLILDGFELPKECFCRVKSVFS